MLTQIKAIADKPGLDSEEFKKILSDDHIARRLERQMPEAIEAPLPESDDHEFEIEDVSIDFPRQLLDPESSVAGGNRYINSRVYDQNTINNMNQRKLGSAESPFSIYSSNKFWLKIYICYPSG